jgi:5-formyltetrahydrofolate cyclo-ligase
MAKSIGLTKVQIRSTIIDKLNSQKEGTRDRRSKIIKEKLLRTRVFQRAGNVMFYIALSGEVKTEAMIKAARKKGKLVTVPVCKKNRMSLRPAILDEQAGLIKGPYGVSEPTLKRFLRLRDLDLVIVPGIAFDHQGNRLGRGKGCYDRFLKRLPKDTATIGLAFGFQILPSLPAAAHDISVQKVIAA